MAIHIERVQSVAGVAADLAEVLLDAVEAGASVGFTQPFSRAEAQAWWKSIEPEVASGRTIVLVAQQDDRVVGTVQLRLATLPNSRHRAEVAKLLVHRRARRQGIARLLMGEIERLAQSAGRTLLVLDTLSQSEAVHLYRALGWNKVGEVPGYAAWPDGTLAATTIFYKQLTPTPTAKDRLDYAPM